MAKGEILGHFLHCLPYLTRKGTSKCRLRGAGKVHRSVRERRENMTKRGLLQINAGRGRGGDGEGVIIGNKDDKWTKYYVFLLTRNATP